MNERTDKKKLLIAVHRMNVGGVQKSLLSALHALDYEHFDVTLYIRQDRCDLLSQADPRVGRIIVNRDPTRYYRKPRAIFYTVCLRLQKLLRRDQRGTQEALNAYIGGRRMYYEKKRYFSDGVRYDAAISYIQGPTAAFVETCVPADKKIVFFHGSVDENHALHEAIFPSFDKIVAVNNDCGEILRKLYPAASEKITVLENYVDARRLKADAAEYPIDRAGKKTVLCTCGRFTPVKGFDLAVQTAALLRDRNVDFLWYFAGDGPERASLEAEIAALKLEKQIAVTGFLQNPYPYIAGCDIYVQPSYEEAQPMSVIESNLLCRPVVTTATVGGRNLVKDGETGLIADFSAADLADKIERMTKETALYDRIRNTLLRTDHSGEKADFCRAWEELLRF